MNNIKTLAEVEKDYVEMRNALISKIKELVSKQPEQTVHVSGEDVGDPTWVLYGIDNDNFEDCSVESVFIDENGDLTLTITASYGETNVALSEDPYLFDSIKWLVNLSYNIYQVLGLDPEKEII